MDAPTFNATRFVRPALLSVIFYFFAVVISSMMMVNPAHATGNVPVSISCSSYTLVNSQSRGEVVFSVPGFPTPGAACAYENFGLGSSFPNGSYSCASPYTFWWAVCAAVNSCPANSMPTGSTCTCTDPYVPDPTQTYCILPACPDHASRTTPDAACACETNYKFDAAGTSCVSICTVDPLPKPPFPEDVDPACTASLERGAGQDVEHVCPSLNPKMTEPNGGQMQCLADKINKLALTPAYTGPSATIRTTAYQKHFVDIWNKSNEIENKDWLLGEEQVCAAVIADVDNEMKRHGIDAPPSKKKSQAPHVLGNALDIPKGVAKAMMAQVNNTTVVIPANCFLFCMPIPVYIGDVQDYVNSATVNPPACDLLWGGRFDDKVHFQLQHP